MSNRIKKQNELYWKQKELRDNSMLQGNYNQINDMRKKQDDLYKMFKFYKGINKALEERKENEDGSKIGK